MLPIAPMYAFDCGSTGALEMSWFHQLSGGNIERPGKSSVSRTSLLDVGAGVGAGEATGGGVATCDELDSAVAAVGAAVVAGVAGVGLVGVNACPPQAAASAARQRREIRFQRFTSVGGARTAPRQIARKVIDWLVPSLFPWR